VKLALVPVALLGMLAVIGIASREASTEALPASPVKLVEVGRFEQPLYVTSPPDDERLFVVEKRGRIRVLRDGHRLPRPFLDLSREVTTSDIEEGLLSLAFAPDYATSGRFYVDYNDQAHRTIVDEFQRSNTNPDVADLGSRRRVLVITNPTDHHHGGTLLFGTDDLLYVSQGDGGGAIGRNFPSQRLDNLHGKILRIDPRARGSRSYGTPSDNPFVGRPGRDEIWVYGLRNPWRFSFDPATGALVIGDVGDLSIEELDIAPRPGLNFGWNCFEGSVRRAAGPPSCDETVAPAIEHSRGSTPALELTDANPTVTRGRPLVDARLLPGEPDCSIVAGFGVQDPALPSLAGRVLYGDFCDPAIRSFRVEDGRAVDVRPLGLEAPVLSSFGRDATNRIYVTSLDGPVYRLEPVP
jgi:hypothetical protein